MDQNTKNVTNSAYTKFFISVAAVALIGVTKDLATLLCIIIVASGFFAYAMIASMKPILLSLGVAAAPFIVYAVTSDIYFALVAFSFVPLGATICYSFKKKLTRSQTIVRVSAVCLMYFSALFCAKIASVYGALNAEIIKNLINDFFDEFKNTTLQLYEAAGEYGIQSGIAVEVIDQYILQLKYSLLGLVILISNGIAFLSTAILRNNVRKDFYGELEAREGWCFVLSKAACIAYAVTYIALIVSYKQRQPYMDIALNALLYAVQGGLVVMGCSVLKRIFKVWNTSIVLKCVFVAVAALLFGSVAFSVLSIMGLFATLFAKKPQSQKKDS